MARQIILGTDTVKAAFEKSNANYTELFTALALTATIETTGTGVGISTLRMESSVNQTLSLTGGAKFYSDAAATLDESTDWIITAGAMRTIYLKCPANSVLTIPKPYKIIKWGSPAEDGWASGSNAAKIIIYIGKLALTDLRMSGTAQLLGQLPSTLLQIRLMGNLITATLAGAMPSGITYFSITGNLITWVYSGKLPETATIVVLSGNLINYTGLDFSGSTNISELVLTNYRVAKMSSADMVTLLTSLTNRVGNLPATITINDYADYAAVPTEVTDAVAALKVAKPNITTVNLGA